MEHSYTLNDVLKKGGKVNQKQKQKQSVNIKNVINIEKSKDKVKRKRRIIHKPSPVASPIVQLPVYNTYNKYFQPPHELNYKSISMANNIPNADNVNPVSGRVSRLINGGVRDIINNNNRMLVIPNNFSQEQVLTVANNSPPKIEEVEDKRPDIIEINLRQPQEHDVEIKMPELEDMGRNYIDYPENENDRLTQGILSPSNLNVDNELPSYSSSSSSSSTPTPLEDEARLKRMTVKDLYKEASEIGVNYSFRTPEKKVKLNKDELVAQILGKRYGGYYGGSTTGKGLP